MKAQLERIFLEKDMTAERIAEQLVKDWQEAGKMPPLAWDFRGFAAEAAKRAAEIEREACAKACEQQGRMAGEAMTFYTATGQCAQAIRDRAL